MSQAAAVLSLRLGGAVLASVAFGLIAVVMLPEHSLPVAVGFGFLFGTSFIGGTGYRIVLAAVSGQRREAPASWSGATAGAALLTLVLWAGALLFGRAGAPVLLGFGIGINVAYLLAKGSCLLVGCCHASDRHKMRLDLRAMEFGGTALVLVISAILAFYDFGVGAVVAVGGHLVIRLISRRLRQRWSWGWPPLTQPGAEIAPLVMVLAAALASL